MMQFGHRYLKDIEGLRFYRLMGTGRGNGFHWNADFSTYGLLAVWDEEPQAESFSEKSGFHDLYNKYSVEQLTVFMLPLKSHGHWGGTNPFKPDAQVDGDIIAVITRATIATKHLTRFWRYVPRASQSLKWHEGLIFAKGIGEWPIKQMATFSIWKDETTMKAYAYNNEDHKRVIKKTRELNWYTEELFARFRPYKSVGTWKGNPLLPF